MSMVRASFDESRSLPDCSTSTSSSKRLDHQLGRRPLDGDAVALHEDLLVGEGLLDLAQVLVAGPEQAGHEVVARARRHSARRAVVMAVGHWPFTWPARFAAEHVQVQVRNRVHGVGPDVEDQPVAPFGCGQPGLVGHGPSRHQHVGQHRPVLGRHGRGVVDVAARDHEHVQVGRRVDVLEGNGVSVS